MSLFHDGIVGNSVNTPRGGGVIERVVQLQYTKTFIVLLDKPVGRFLRKPVTHVHIAFDNMGRLLAM